MYVSRLREGPDADSVQVTKVYYQNGAGKMAGQGHDSNPDQSPKGTVWQAVSGLGQADVNNPGWWDKVEDGRQAQGQDRQNGQN